jgi:hypothetical protein
MKHTFLNLKEAFEKDPELGSGAWKNLVDSATKHPIVSRALKEGLFSDGAAALGGMQNTVIDAAYPTQISRELLKVIPTKSVAQRFYKGKVGYVFDNEGHVMATGPKVSYLDISVNKTYTAKQEWNQDFAEDVPWNVASWEAEKLGLDIAKQETTDVVALFNAIAAGSLAGGAEVTITDGAPTWTQIIAGLTNLWKVDRNPSVVAMNPHEFGGLMLLPEFINSLYNSGEVRNGVIKHTTLGISFISCSLITKTLFVDTNYAGALLLRQDIMTQPWEDRANFMYGISARERAGLGILFADAVARGTN